jgi:hypothetical protein
VGELVADPDDVARGGEQAAVGVGLVGAAEYAAIGDAASLLLVERITKAPLGGRRARARRSSRSPWSAAALSYRFGGSVLHIPSLEGSAKGLLTGT